MGLLGVGVSGADTTLLGCRASGDDRRLLYTRMLTYPATISPRMCSNVLRARAVTFLNLERTECSDLAVQGVSYKLRIPAVTIGRGIMYTMYRRG